ncbi:hypothetical protein [Ramlibacter sp.]|uniref:hypothetical protein n=1 Tax=Ramlibacter sp. TaxID=1917967 RepID=UPI0017BBE40A|nr:hypothetical protein [Ramlibacter sp.]MBA2675870.1 hypothetical protein [Ramlibacter sp.]
MKRTLLTASLLAACGLVLAKLPPPDDEAKAKAAETAAKAGWQAKIDAYQLCKAQDRVVAAYRKGAGGAAVAASAVKTTAAQPAAAQPAAAMPPAVAAKPASAAVAIPAPAMAMASAAKPGASAATGAVTPVAAALPTPCSDPGAFAYAPPEQKPLEAAGAHSPAATAASPPSVNATSGEMAPAKK